jgi:uncharacterized protein YndB with AHSA1/START domain
VSDAHVRKSVRLACSPERAFALFTERAGEWWPADRRHTADPHSEIRALASGRFFERAHDGTEVELGHVRSWEPPSRLVLDFFVGTGANTPTLVIVTFVAEGDGTRVSVDHGPTDASAELYRSRAPRFAASWERVLEALTHAAARA